jgi:hypothetical protein
MGVAVINSALGLIFKDRRMEAEKLRVTLETLVLFKASNAKSENDRAFWKGAGGTSINFNDFLDYVLQPFVAILLITEDLGLTESEAENTRSMSRRYGLKFNFETDDGRVDEITMGMAMSAHLKVVLIYSFTCRVADSKQYFARRRVFQEGSTARKS